LIDARHQPTELDLQLNEWLLFHQKPHLIVATKADKLSANELSKSLAAAKKQLTDSKIMGYSSQTGRGRDELWSEIKASMNIL